MVDEAGKHAEADTARREVADLKNSAEGLVYTTEKSLEEFSSSLGESDLQEIQADLDGLKAILAEQDIEPGELKEALQRLEGSAYRIAEAMYGEAEGG